MHVLYLQLFEMSYAISCLVEILSYNNLGRVATRVARSPTLWYGKGRGIGLNT